MKWRAAAIALCMAMPAQASDCDHTIQFGEITLSNPALGVDHLLAGRIMTEVDFSKHEICHSFLPQAGVTILPARICMRPGEKAKTVTVELHGLTKIQLHIQPEATEEKFFRQAMKCEAI